VEKIRGRRHRVTLQNYKATWTSLLTNEKAKSTFTRRLLCLYCPLTWALDFFSKVSRTTTRKTYLNAEMTLKIYKSTNRLKGKNQDAVLLTSDSDTELSNRFSHFFLGKIKIIRENLRKANENNDNVVIVLGMDVQFTGQHLTWLIPASSDEIRKLLA